ncbi:MAG: sigma-54-dependent Fis family transcriptional regulator [Deltaproteobacteria bacterium]|nr:sigma-54-dependent Fis family transcriptional regulator [Deltaproteobacteria bacterium]
MLRTAAGSEGYLELFGEGEEPGYWTAVGVADDALPGLRESVSRGIVAEAVAAGRAITTPAAFLDPRFRDRGSVQRARVEAVLCAPIGTTPPIGVLYVAGRSAPGPFDDADLARAELFGRHLAPLAHRLIHARRGLAPDPTAELRARLDVDDLVGRSPALAGLLREVAVAAPLAVSVLITGETGTGKSHLARAIHRNGPRASRPYVELNCAAIPEPLMESELFGALPGAHSTARTRIEGKVAAAEGGTLFLDEITELSISAQAKLLQLLQSREYWPLGSSRPQIADVRILAATNLDLRRAVEARTFREDLLYRLQVLRIRMPALAERREDIEPLAVYFASVAARTHRLPAAPLSSGALGALCASAFPGNVRELAHLVEAGVIRAAAEDSPQVEARHLMTDQPGPVGEPGRGRTFLEETRDFHADLLRRTLEEQGWNVAATARRLDLTRSHVYNLIRQHGLLRE